jgi:branched-chain amino acid transport system substrate-binding protein
MKLNVLSKMLIAIILVFSIVCVTFFSSCAPSAPSVAPTTTSKPIRIGISLPLTGPFAVTAKDVKLGYESWAKVTNAKGGLLGRPIQLIILDDVSDPAKAATNYEKLITVDEVDLLLGGYPGTANVATMPLAEKYRMVFVGMGGHMQAMQQGFKYSFGSPPLLGEWSGTAYAGVFDFIPTNERPKTVGIMTMNNVIGKSVRDGAVIEFNKLGLKIVMDEVYTLPLTDATTLVAKAKELNAEMLFACGAFDDGVLTIRAAKALNYLPKLICQNMGCTSPAWTKELGKDGYYVVGPVGWSPNLPDLSYPGTSEIRKAGQEAYGAGIEIPQFFGFGYMWGMTLGMAVEGTVSLDQNKIRDYLATQSLDLPYGKGIRFDNRGLPPKFGFASQVLNGKVELVWPKEAATAKFVYPRPNWE